MNQPQSQSEKTKALNHQLQRQISKHLQGVDIDKLMPFLNAVSKAYANSETVQAQLERKIELGTNAVTEKTTGESIPAMSDFIRNIDGMDYLLKDSYEIMTIVHTDSTVVYQSPAFYKICGYTKEEIVGVKGFDHIHPDDLLKVGEIMRQGIEKPGTLHTAKYRALRGDGKYIWFESVGKYIEEEGFEGIVLNTREITQRRHYEARLSIKLRILETISNTLPVVIYKVNAEGKLTSCKGNAMKKWGLTEQQIIENLTIYDIHPTRREEIQKAFSGEFVTFVGQSTYDDEEAYLENYIFLDESGPEKGLVCFAIDITAGKEDESRLKDYYATLERTNRELDQFAYIVSHDLKAPLRAISNLSIWIEEDLEGSINDDAKKNFDMLRGRIHRMESLINGILEYSRAGRAQSTPSKFNISSMVTEAVNVLAPPTNFTVEIQQDMPDVNSDRVKIEQVFSNFISNAVKYNNNPAPSIKINYKEDATHYIFCVEDNGPGIDPDYHEKVFVIFQTLQARDKIESTGVGLAIVKKIVEDAGGTVWVESEPGSGSKFYFTLPKTLAIAA